MKKINWLMIGLLVAIPIVLIGIYVGDYFWVENYKAVPVYSQHIFGNDLTSYIIYDHITCGIIVGLIIIVLEVWVVLTFRKNKK